MYKNHVFGIVFAFGIQRTMYRIMILVILANGIERKMYQFHEVALFSFGIERNMYRMHGFWIVLHLEYKCKYTGIINSAFNISACAGPTVA